MSIVTVENLAMSFGAQDVFHDVEFSLARGDKVALVGPNGAGKTTLLRILLGLEEPTAGRVHRARNLRIGYLPQQATFQSEQTLRDEMLSVFADLRRQHKALLDLAQSMATAENPATLMERYAQAEQRFELAGGYDYENRISRVLTGLGFSPEQHDWPISVLSGGQVTRALLAKILLEEPELLVLDEPTNYLDLEALQWLESYLQAWPNSLLVVSHDRYFLDQVVSRVLELENGSLNAYRGNYSSYVMQRQERRRRQQRDFEEQQEIIAHTEEFIRRNKAGQRSREARGRQTRLERLERVEVPVQERRLSLQLRSGFRSGNKVLETEGVTIGYPRRPEEDGADEGSEHRLLETGPLLILRGQRIALLGPNGSGKTTFLRTILGQVQPLKGSIRLGASVRIGYLPQTKEWLDPHKTPLGEVMEAGKMLAGAARGYLARFLFTGDEVFKQIGTLSGGEQARLALAIVSLKGANLLLLDEPTTHLDVQAQEVLQQVLQGYDGTIIMVSHDRYLIDALATHVWVVNEHSITQYEGNYSSYLTLSQKAKENNHVSTPPRGTRHPVTKAQNTTRRPRQSGIEERIDTLEEEIGDLERVLASLAERIDEAGAARDVPRVQSLGHQYEALQRALVERLHEWETALSAEDEG